MVESHFGMGRKEKEEGRKRRRKEEKEEEGKRKERKKVGSFRFFLRHFIYFQTRIGIFAGYRGSPGQIFFRISAKKHFKKNPSLLIHL